jgi:hypothetical protein
VSADSRGWRIAVVCDTLVNPPDQLRATLPNVLAILDANGYGVLQLPPSGDHRRLLAVTADQVAEYAHHGYAILALGLTGEPSNGLHWRRLAPLLRHRNVPPPPRHIVRSDVNAALEAERLTAVLVGYDLPLEEQQRWRV